MEEQSIPALGHTAGDWYLVEEATCEEPGREASCCTVCQQGMIREIPAKGHTASRWSTLEEATCESPGKKALYCSNCGEIMEEQSIPALGHTAGDWYLAKEATCEEPGREVSCCTVCQQDMIREIPAKGHDWVNGYCTRCQRQQSGN